jgi:hypothetical protein
MTLSIRTYCPLALLSVTIAAAATFPVPTGTAAIKGTVTSAAGVAISGARIVYGRGAAGKYGAPILLPPSSTATTAKDGSFALTNLPAATYVLCVQVVNTAYLDPCHWSNSAPTYKLSAGQTISNAAIKLTLGHSLQIRVNDPQQQLKNEGKTPGSYVHIGAWAPSGALHMAALVASDAAGRTYSVSIPFDTPVNLSVLSGGFQLADANGVALPSIGSGTSVTASSTGIVNPITYTVKGTP